MVGQRGIQVSGLRIRFMALNSRAIYQSGVGGGLSLKKTLRQSPLLIVDVDGLFFYSLNKIVDGFAVRFN